jgi:hypothetical protein
VQRLRQSQVRLPGEITKWTFIQCCVDRHRFDADPDPDLHVDDDPEQDPNPSFMYTELNSRVLKILRKRNNFHNFYSQQGQFTMIFLSHQWQKCHNFKYFGRHIKILWKKLKRYKCMELIRHALDANPDPDPAK